MQAIVRGTSVDFVGSFVDADGAAVTPTTVTLEVSFPLRGRRRDSEAVSMTDNAGTWSGRWQSDGAYYGSVYWSMKATQGTIVITEDGEFELTANAANRAAEDEP